MESWIGVKFGKGLSKVGHPSPYVPHIAKGGPVWLHNYRRNWLGVALPVLNSK